jgi:hypothetical protein
VADPSKSSDRKAGYHLRSTDSVRLLVDLMNANEEDKIIYVTFTYDYIEGELQPGWSDVKPIWLDADQCGLSEVESPKNENGFSLASKPWKASFDGTFIGMGTHVHDGGLTADVLVKDAKGTRVACHTEARYGETPQYLSTGHGQSGFQKHISSIDSCYDNQIKELNLSKDQLWSVNGTYETDSEFNGTRPCCGYHGYCDAFCKGAPWRCADAKDISSSGILFDC